MARYFSTETCYVNDRLYAPLEPFDFDGPPGPHMQPARDEKGREDKDARRAKDEAMKTDRPAPGNPEFLPGMIDHYAGSGNGSTNALAGGTLMTANGSMATDNAPLGVRVDGSGQVRGLTQEPNPADATGPAQPATSE